VANAMTLRYAYEVRHAKPYFMPETVPYLNTAYSLARGLPPRGQ
jgi:hypothetical protein